jgi:hypothetical protein
MRLMRGRGIGEARESFEQFFRRRELGDASRCDMLDTSLDVPPCEIGGRSKLHHECAGVIEVGHVDILTSRE